MMSDVQSKRNSAEQRYLEYCEELFQSWLDGTERFKELGKEFGKVFSLDCAPEPYIPLLEGRNPLYVLNYNPGQPLEDIQGRAAIRGNYPGWTYQQISAALAEYYKGELDSRVHQAWTRFQRMMEYSRGLGFQGVQSMETFFLHSRNIKARTFLVMFGQTSQVLEYTRLLKEHLRDKPVLSIAAVASQNSITKKTLSDDKWVSHLVDIIGMDFGKARLIPITVKENKDTSVIMVQGDKYLVAMMGSNSLPIVSAEKFREILAKGNGKC